jgi:hypothetical protein
MSRTAKDRLFDPLQAVEETPALLAAANGPDDLTIAGRKLKAEVSAAVSDIVLNLDIESAPYIEVTFDDKQLKVLRSGMFGKGNLDGDGITARLAGVDWRLVGVRKGSDNTLTCTFEDDVVVALRSLKRVRVATRGKVNRAQFLLARARELRPRVKFVCPELNDKQPLKASVGAKGKAASYGIADKAKVTVKRVSASSAQRRTMNRILDVGASVGAPRKVMEAAIAAATQESTMSASAVGKSGVHIGLFQMDAAKGTVTQRKNVEYAAAWFFRTAMAIHKANPSIGIAALCERVEGSGQGSLYQAWVTEAKNTVTAYMGSGKGDAPGTNRRKAVTGKYLFSIGPPGGEKKESYWDGSQRLATEVEWRYYVIANTIYLASETRLFASRALLTINEDDAFVRSLEFDVDSGLNVSEASLVVDAARWSVPPGSTIELEDAGPATGKWLVTKYTQSLYSNVATISMRKPKPKLPEPATQQGSQTGTKTGTRGDSALGDIQVSGPWGGTQSIFTQFVTPALKRRGLTAGSQKRSPAQNAAIGGSSGSDHLTSKTNSYAIDYPTRNGEAAARELAKDMGYPGWKPNSFARFSITVDGKKFTVQILWGSSIDHDDHIHVGIQRA